MAPTPKRITRLGQAMRAARAALNLDQRGLAQRAFVSSRLVSRWENGLPPSDDNAERIFAVLHGAPPDIVRALADALDIEILDAAPPAAPAPPPVAPMSVAPAPVAAPIARPSSSELRASLDSIVYAASEQRDILPRHLRAFGVELLQAADRLGLSAKDAAALIAVPEKTIAKVHVPS